MEYTRRASINQRLKDQLEREKLIANSQRQSIALAELKMKEAERRLSLVQDVVEEVLYTDIN